MVRFNVKTSSTNMNVESESINMAVAPAVFVGAEGQTYSGTYIVTPAVDAQQMFTKNKYMKDDVTVEAIPYSAVSNDSDGTTVTIG